MSRFPEIEYRSQPEQVVGPVDDAHGLLKSVYSNPAVPLNTRIKAASLAIEYERPRLAVSAAIEGKDFGAILDRAVLRSRQLDRTNGTTKVIEHQADEGLQARAKVSDHVEFEDGL
jgi:hypothetical protein